MGLIPDVLDTLRAKRGLDGSLSRWCRPGPWLLTVSCDLAAKYSGMDILPLKRTMYKHCSAMVNRILMVGLSRAHADQRLYPHLRLLVIEWPTANDVANPFGRKSLNVWSF